MIRSGGVENKQVVRMILLHMLTSLFSKLQNNESNGIMFTP